MIQASVVTAADSVGRLVVQMPAKPTTDLVIADRQVCAAARAGDLVMILLDDAGSAFVVGIIGSAATAPTASGAVDQAPETTAASTGAFAIQPVYTGAWRTSESIWFPSSDLISGDWAPWYGHFGVAYFGGQLRAVGKEITSMTVHLVRKQAGAYAAGTPTMTLLAGDDRPSAAPTVLATAPGPSLAVGDVADWTVPAGWLPRLSQGGDAGGIGTQGNPYMRLDGTALRAAGTWRSQ